MPRPLRLYRLDVVLPPGSDPAADDYDPDWEPPNWREIDRDLYARTAPRLPAPDGDPFGDEPDMAGWEPSPFFWPAARIYRSRSGAETRADLFRRYGAVVTVVASNPVTWPDGHLPARPMAADPDEWASEPTAANL